MSIEAGASVGVVGRTGAGKSSLIAALFRMCPLREGRILIDQVDIASVGLHTLRGRLAIIPQDPVLFSGNLRFNLDPFEEVGEEALWAMLEQVQLRSFVEEQEKRLEMPILAGGENLSVGQRQLLCLARALLKRARILVLDEATASVDFATDETIQRVLRREVTAAGSTVLCVAHRVRTILGYKYVVVMDDGQVAEFGPTTELAERPGGRFHALCVESEGQRGGAPGSAGETSVEGGSEKKEDENGAPAPPPSPFADR